jgi:hypothetical protein
MTAYEDILAIPSHLNVPKQAQTPNAVRASTTKVFPVEVHHCSECRYLELYSPDTLSGPSF